MAGEKLDILAGAKGHTTIVFSDSLSEGQREILLIERGLTKHITEFLQTQSKVQDDAKRKTEEVIQSSSRFYGVEDIRKELLENIKNELLKQGKSLKDVVSVVFYSDVAQLKLNDGKTINIDLSPRVLEEMIIKKVSVEDRHSLGENIPKMLALAGGLGVVFYEVIPSTYEYFVKEIHLDIEGREEIIKLDKKFSSVQDFNKSIFTILEEKGFRFNTATLKFENIVDPLKDVTPSNILRALNSYSYEEYVKDMKSGELSQADFAIRVKEGVYPENYTYDEYLSDRKNMVLSESDFKEKKKAGKIELEKIIAESNGRVSPEGFGRFLMKTENLVKFMGMNLHVILFPVFFKSIHKNPQNLGSYMAAFCERGLFTTGAKLGQKAGSLVPHPVFKIPAMIVLGLVGGMGATFFGHKVGEFLEVERHFYKEFPNTEDFSVRVLGFSDEKSLIAHILSGGVINDFSDFINSDIGIFQSKINFFHTKLDFSVNPRVYLAERKKDISFWNTRLEEFRERIIPQLREEIDFIRGQVEAKQKIRNSPPDAVFLYGKEGALQQCDKLIVYHKQVIKDLILGQYGDGDLGAVQKYVYADLQQFVANIEYEKIDATVIEFVLNNSINKLKIDEKFYRDLREKLEGRNSERYFIEAGLLGKAKELGVEGKGFEDVLYVSGFDKKRREFITRIFTRLIDEKKPPILDTSLPDGEKKIYTMYETVPSKYSSNQIEVHTTSSMMFTSFYVEILSEEQVMWKELMNDKKFFTFFKRMLYYKRENEFLNNIQKYGTAFKWGI